MTMHAICRCGKGNGCSWPECDQGPIEEEKRQLREMLRMIAKAQEKASKPYLDRLAQLESLKMPTIVVSAESIDYPLGWSMDAIKKEKT